MKPGKKMSVKFSLLVVCLNAGEKLKETMDSIRMQTYGNYEVLVKDGGSTDGSVEKLEEHLARSGESRICVIHEKDTGIYDAMNQACAYMTGDYCLFLNCGDYFYSEQVLERFAEAIGTERKRHIFYGNRYQAQSGSIEYSAPQITAFTCYRNIPCHQTCFYSTDLFRERQYHTRYKVRADYEHFLWCYFQGKARFTYVPECVVSYEGGGFSETKENERQSAKEHREITGMYMTLAQRFQYRAYLILTLAPLRHALATNPRFADAYNNIVKKFYHR